MDLFKDLMYCGWKDGRTEGQRQNSIQPQTQFAGGGGGGGGGEGGYNYKTKQKAEWGELLNLNLSFAQTRRGIT